MHYDLKNMQIHISRNGQNLGHYALDEINRGLLNGVFALSDLAWHEGLPEWGTLASIAGVRIGSSSVEAPPSSPEPPTWTPSPPPLPASPAKKWAILIVCLLVLWATNPDSSAHRTKLDGLIMAKHPIKGIVGVGSVAFLEYHDYWFFSTTSNEEADGYKIYTIGVLDMVFISSAGSHYYEL